VRYDQSREKTAELLRLALGHMGKHPAAFNPLTFTLWYEYAASINPELITALDLALTKPAPIDDALVHKLYEEHIVSVDAEAVEHIVSVDAEAVERIGVDMERLMRSVVHTASQTGHHAGAFGAQLTGLTEALAANDAEALAPKLSEVLASASVMKNSVDSLQKKVSASQEEIARLRGDLERARGEALLDPMTGIFNRRGFEQKLQALITGNRTSDDTHCLVMLDIDHFKKVNDNHGHLMGDRVIQAVGEILRVSVTQEAHAAARYGGEEFAILMPSASVDQSASLAESVRERTKAIKIRKRDTQEVLFSVTLSGGVASLQPGDDAAALIARADAALYQAKQTGRDRVVRA
jgi:diguanylate cyclase